MHTTTIPWNSTFWSRALETFVKSNVSGSSLNALTEPQLVDFAKGTILSLRTFPQTEITPEKAETLAQQDIDAFFAECNETIDAGVEILIHSNMEGMCGAVDDWVSDFVPHLDIPGRNLSESEDEYLAKVDRVKKHNKRHNWCLYGVRSLIQKKFKMIYGREA